MIDQKLLEEINEQADNQIVKIIGSFIPVINKGKNFLAKCPFHDDSNPSMHISPEKKIFKCFACGEGGNAITFVQKYLHISYIEAVKKVAEILGISDTRLIFSSQKTKVDEKKESLIKCLKDLTLYYQYALNIPEGKEGLEYFTQRNIDANTREKFLLGYALKDGVSTCNYLQAKGHSLKTIEDTGIATLISGNLTDKNQGRVIIPICDDKGNVIGYSARRINDSEEAKYVNTPETYLFHKSNVLYNYHIAKDKAKNLGYIYICEGFMDIFALSKIGVDNAVALMGTALTNEHISLLKQLNVEIRMCLDGDLPGQKATLKNLKLLLNAGLTCQIVDNLGQTKDPDEILNEDGEEALKNYLNKLLSYIDFIMNFYQTTCPLSSIEERKKFVIEFIPILLNIHSKLEYDSYLKKVANVSGFEIDSINEVVNNARKSKNITKNELSSTFHPERKLLRKLQFAERELLFQMLNNKEAVIFYEKNVGTFYDEIYRAIANFILEYASNKDTIVISDIINLLQVSEINNKDELIKELTDLTFDKAHPKICNDALLENLLNSINIEKQKIFEKDTLEMSLQGKEPLEQARILSEYNKKKKIK